MPRSLWFKAAYVDPILTGAKCDTIRKGTVSYPLGTRIPASVGARAPFALLEVLACEPVHLTDLNAERQASLQGLYPDAQEFTRITFRVVH